MLAAIVVVMFTYCLPWFVTLAYPLFGRDGESGSRAAHHKRHKEHGCCEDLNDTSQGASPPFPLGQRKDRSPYD